MYILEKSRYEKYWVREKTGGILIWFRTLDGFFEYDTRKLYKIWRILKMVQVLFAPEVYKWSIVDAFCSFFMPYFIICLLLVLVYFLSIYI